MGVGLERDEAIADHIREMFESRGRRMADNNLRQADVPVGASIIPQRRGTAPGLICPVDDKVDLRGSGGAARDEGDARAGDRSRSAHSLR